MIPISTVLLRLRMCVAEALVAAFVGLFAVFALLLRRINYRLTGRGRVACRRRLFRRHCWRRLRRGHGLQSGALFFGTRVLEAHQPFFSTTSAEYCANSAVFWNANCIERRLHCFCFLQKNSAMLWVSPSCLVCNGSGSCDLCPEVFPRRVAIASAFLRW